jgi:IclR family pca regulon transcriptional regulator
VSNVSCRTGDPLFMTTLARGLHVMRAFSGIGHHVSIVELSRATGLDRAVVRRCLYTLRELGYVAAEGRRYVLQPKVIHLGIAELSTGAFPVAAQSVLEELSERLGTTASVGVLDEAAVVYLARATNRGMSATSRVGTRLPAYCSAIGRVLLASLPEQQAALELSKVELVPHTRFTVTARDRIEEILDDVRDKGYALNDRELKSDLRAIAVAVRNAVGQPVAAMGVSCQVSRASCHEMVSRHLPLLRTAAVRLGRQFS